MGLNGFGVGLVRKEENARVRREERRREEGIGVGGIVGLGLGRVILNADGYVEMLVSRIWSLAHFRIRYITAPTTTSVKAL